MTGSRKDLLKGFSFTKEQPIRKKTRNIHSSKPLQAPSA